MTPSKGKVRVTSPYGYRTHPITGKYQHHNGIDSVAENRNIRSIWDCVKTEAVPGYNYGRGNLVRLYYSNTLRVIFQHLEKILIKTGQTVKQGDVVGVMGTTGDSTGVHLHSEVQVLRGGKWVAVNPSAYINIPNKVGTYMGNDNLDNPRNGQAEGDAETEEAQKYRVYAITYAGESREAALKEFVPLKEEAPKEIILTNAGGDGKWRIGRVVLATENLNTALENMTPDRFLA